MTKRDTAREARYYTDSELARLLGISLGAITQQAVRRQPTAAQVRVGRYPAKRGRGGRYDTRETPEQPTAASRGAAMAGFCSCKTGIHAFHGNNLHPEGIKARRLKRVFGIDIDKSAGQPVCTAVGRREAVGHSDVSDETCPASGGAVRIAAPAPPCARGICESIHGRNGGAFVPAAAPGGSRRWVMCCWPQWLSSGFTRPTRPRGSPWVQRHNA